MKQINQRRNQIGFVYKTYVNNDIGKVNEFRNPVNVLIKKHTSDNFKEIDMEGEGFRDIIKSIYNKGKEGVKFLYRNKDKIQDAYSGEIGTAIRNALPSSDDTARSGFAREKHGILQLPNGKYGVANYMGPNTNLLERLKRGDPPRTECDRASQAHDIRYALAKTTDDIRKADNIMMNAVDRISRNRGDNVKNIAQARLIKAKIIGEDLGLIRRDAFSGDLSKNVIADTDRSILMNKLGSLSQEGYGKMKGRGKMLPGDALKMKLLKQMVKEKKMKGIGVDMTRDLGKPYKLVGSGGILDFVVNNVIPSLMKQVGIPQELVSTSQLKSIISKSLEMAKSGNISSIIEHLSKTILPILFHLKSKSMSGSGRMTGYGKMKVKLINSLSRGLTKSFKHYIKIKNRKNRLNQTGKGLKLAGRSLNQCGRGFWEDFKRGFLSVFKPGAKVLGSVASAMGMPEFGIPLGVLADNL
jgi:hypothetical protein